MILFCRSKDRFQRIVKMHLSVATPLPRAATVCINLQSQATPSSS